MTEIIIRRKKSSYYKLLLTFALVLFLLIRSLIRNLSPYNEGRLWIIIFLSMCVLLGLVIVVNTIIQMLKNRPALVINDSGISDHVSLSKAGFISWDNIISSEIKRYQSRDHLFIKLRDASEVISKQKGFKKQMIEQVQKHAGTPIAINLTLIDIAPVKLKSIIDEMIAGRQPDNASATK